MGKVNFYGKRKQEFGFGTLGRPEKASVRRCHILGLPVPSVCSLFLSPSHSLSRLSRWWLFHVAQFLAIFLVFPFVFLVFRLTSQIYNRQGNEKSFREFLITCFIFFEYKKILFCNKYYYRNHDTNIKYNFKKYFSINLYDWIQILKFWSPFNSKI